MMLKVLLPVVRSLLGRATPDEKRALIQQAYTLLQAIVNADVEVAELTLDQMDAPEDVRALIMGDLWVFDDYD